MRNPDVEPHVELIDLWISDLPTSVAEIARERKRPNFTQDVDERNHVSVVAEALPAINIIT